MADALPTTPEDARAKAVRQLVEPGEERVRLAAELERLDARLRPLILEAVSAGVPYRRLAELTGISRATVARWGKSAEQ
ncbi:helix-turn-helix domain-containing protein [Streptomyces sp. NPDC091215]|uniref:helix-turn-helix domain-containing protein n=1 Tax=Streptomyces sp. NPDC091215 TaxID=3155192 RepID=UPI003417E87D